LSYTSMNWTMAWKAATPIPAPRQLVP